MKQHLGIKNLHVTVEEAEVLKGLNLAVDLGKVHVIMGPNGAGKCIGLNDEIIINNRLLSGYQLLALVKESDAYLQESGLIFEKKFLIYDWKGEIKDAVPYFENYQGVGYYIKTKSGREITVTPGHKLLTFSKQKKWKRSEKIGEKEFIAIPRKIRFAEKEELPHPNKWTKKIDGDFSITEKETYFLIKARLPMGWHHKDYEMKVQKKYDTGLVEFFAILSAEGYIRKNDISITQKIYADKLFKITKTLYRMGIVGKIEQNKGSYVLRVQNKLFYLFLKHAFGIDEENRVPNTIFDFSEELKRFYLRWMYTFDGHIDKKGHEVELTQKRKSTINYVNYLLLSFGIIGRVSPKKVKGKMYYRLGLWGNENLTRFIFNIGMFDEEKNNRIRQYLKKKKRKGYKTTSDMIPFDNEKLKKVLKFIRYSLFKNYRKIKDTKWYAVRYRNWKRDVYYISKGKYTAMIKDLEDYLRIIISKKIAIPKNIEDILDELFESLNFYWDRVARKKQIKLKGVYDLSVLDKNHSFIGGFGGIVLHNSTLAHTLMGHPRYKITQGTITLDGEDITTLSPTERAKRGLFLSFQYPSEITGVTMSNFLRTAYNSVKKEKLDVVQFHQLLKEKMIELHMDTTFSKRYLNEGFSGGEKKKAEILQLLVLQPRYAILDECDSGLDVSALKIVGEGINKMKAPGRGILLITHYSRILKYIHPDVVSMMVDGKVVKSGGKELVMKIEERGFAK